MFLFQTTNHLILFLSLYFKLFATYLSRCANIFFKYQEHIYADGTKTANKMFTFLKGY